MMPPGSWPVDHEGVPMKADCVYLTIFGIGIAAAMSVLNEATSQIRQAAAADELRPAATFASIADQRARSIALFEEAGKVLQHPRCVNCHPVGERPRQTDARRLHIPLVVRGTDGFGAPGMRCKTCHHDNNFDRAGIPGNDHWHLAPASMTWEGRSLGQICEQLKDPARNGNRDISGILNHVVTDTLIIWAWSPGDDRTPAPGTNAQFGELLRAWADTGGYCPSP
jgi:hypothetical protein